MQVKMHSEISAHNLKIDSSFGGMLLVSHI